MSRFIHPLRRAAVLFMGALLSVPFGFVAAAASPEAGSETLPSIPAGFALVPAGSFQMGDALGDGAPDEVPVHTVTLGVFYMEKKLVTKLQWDTVYAWAVAHGYSFSSDGDAKAPDHPVHTVSWFDAVKWCNARSEKEGLKPCYHTDSSHGAVYRTGELNLTNNTVDWTANGFRLPTEAEWEKAARGGLSGQRFPWGNTISHSQANYYSTYCRYDVSPTREYHPAYDDGVHSYTNPVTAFAANGYGLYDMAGNLREWCWDWYGAYGSQSELDPAGPFGPEPIRILRSGSWLDPANFSRVTCRGYINPSGSRSFIGFRCVRK